MGVVTLALGGIGVMNIMLVAVKERTREIGVRKALGATTRSIQQQFFLEGFFLTLLSGGAGMLLALGLCQLVNLAPMPERFAGMILSLAGRRCFARHARDHRHRHLDVSGAPRRANCRRSRRCASRCRMSVTAAALAGRSPRRLASLARPVFSGILRDVVVQRHRPVPPLVPCGAVDARHLVGHRVGGGPAGLRRRLSAARSTPDFAGAFSDGVAVTMLGQTSLQAGGERAGKRVRLTIADVEAIGALPLVKRRRARSS